VTATSGAWGVPLRAGRDFCDAIHVCAPKSRISGVNETRARFLLAQGQKSGHWPNRQWPTGPTDRHLVVATSTISPLGIVRTNFIFRDRQRKTTAPSTSSVGSPSLQPRPRSSRPASPLRRKKPNRRSNTLFHGTAPYHAAIVDKAASPRRVVVLLARKVCGPLPGSILAAVSASTCGHPPTPCSQRTHEIGIRRPYVASDSLRRAAFFCMDSTLPHRRPPRCRLLLGPSPLLLSGLLYIAVIQPIPPLAFAGMLLFCHCGQRLRRLTCRPRTAPSALIGTLWPPPES